MSMLSGSSHIKSGAVSLLSAAILLNTSAALAQSSEPAPSPDVDSTATVALSSPAAVTDTPLATTVAAAASDQTVAAASSTGTASSGRSTQTLETVTVTAEKRKVSVQDAPIAITAISGAALDKSNVTQMSDLNGLVPGLTIAKSSGFERIASIRGIGSETPENAFTTQPGVSFYVDGVYIANTISLDEALFDVDHLEISRGPQATVFGQASTGGTINLISNQPQLHRLEGSVEGSGGTYDLYRTRDMINVPIGDTLALRGSVQVYGHEGFATTTDIPGFRLDGNRSASGKLALLWAPTDNFTATITGQVSHGQNPGAEQKNILDTNPDPRVVSQDYPSYFKLNTQLYHLNLDWELPWAVAKSVTSYQLLNHNQQENGTRWDEANIGYFDHVEAWSTGMRNLSQDLTLSSRPGGFFDWTVGAFYMNQKNHQYVYETSNYPGPASQVDPYLLYGDDSHITRQSYSVYGQATMHVRSDLRLTAGIRYNRDKYAGPDSVFFGTPSHTDYDKGLPTGKLEAQYDLSPLNTAYLSWTHGYKPGGLNSNPNAVVVTHTFKPETIDAYELGSKNRFLDRKLLVNVAGYFYNYRNMQYLAVDPVPYNYGVSNIPQTHIMGLELESSYLALQNHLRLNATLSLAHGEVESSYKTLDARQASLLISQIPDCQNGGAYYSQSCWSQMVAQSPDVKGNGVPKMPHLQGSANAAYTSTLFDYELLSRVEYIYRGAFQYRIFDDGGYDNVSSYSQWNLFFQLTPPWQQNLSVSLAVSNLFNKAGINSRYTDPYGTGQTSDEFIPPRQIIGTISYQF